MNLQNILLLAVTAAFGSSFLNANEAAKKEFHISGTKQVLSGKVVSEINTDIVYADITKADLKEESLKAYSPWDEDLSMHGNRQFKKRSDNCACQRFISCDAGAQCVRFRPRYRAVGC